MTDGPIDVWSGSSLNTFLRCAKQWEFAYVYRYRRPPKLRMVLGTAAHYAAEVDLRQKIETHEDLPVDELVDAYADTYDKEAEEAEEAKNETRGEMKDKGVKSVRFWRAKVAPLIQPALVEEPISFIINGIPWTGTIDLVDENDVVVDHKFTSKTPSSADNYILNMVGYAIGFRKASGRVESQVRLDHVVALKETKYVPIRSDGPVPDQSIVAFAEIVDTANRSVQAGLFPPTGLKSGACSWCGYQSICPAYRDSPMGRNKEYKEEAFEMDLKRSLTVLQGGK
ncbi:MAG TPA: PD-(D/E)XK nuclease family protein [Candidatus Limnocylindrales bacterium]|nr:PD-(D/E)XK nuclease family protein [Candidatus Limnocylindrales bacterium]